MTTKRPRRSSRRAIQVDHSAAVQTDSTLVFGKITTVVNDRMYLEADVALERGSTIDLRFELTPLAGTALVRASVARVLAVAEGELPRYAVELVSIAEADRERCETWLESKRTGGTLSTFSGVSDIALGAGRAGLRAAMRPMLGSVTVLE